MNESKVPAAPSINGHMVALDSGLSIAIYERNRQCYVAEFRDGHGEFTYAGLWFRLEASRFRCRLAALRPAAPLTPEMQESIERLHRESELREERMLAVFRTVAATARNYLIGVTSRLRDGASKINQTLG